jgi:hypothetical protein
MCNDLFEIPKKICNHHFYNFYILYNDRLGHCHLHMCIFELWIQIGAKVEANLTILYLMCIFATHFHTVLY